MNIWWIRRDVRLADNNALDAAAAGGQGVLPLFILDPVFWQTGRIAEKRASFLLAGLRSLDADLRARGSRLVVRTGRPLEVLRELAGEVGAGAIYAEEDYTPYARRRDAAVASVLPLKLVPGLTVFHPTAVHKADGTPYTVFTPFSKNWRTLRQPETADLIAAPSSLPLLQDVSSDPLPAASFETESLGFPAGEAEALRRLENFASGPVYRYEERRNRPDLDATSGLSPYLRFGMLSARQAVVRAIRAIETAPNRASVNGAETWLNELIWREFFQAILYHFPFVRTQSFRPAYRQIPWENDAQDFADWKSGRTGYPFVDAAMRQLSSTGWMHNRARMVVASFLVKDLAVDWRMGEDWFMQHLLDGDVAANNGGWQWSAGTGTDAAPYFRIFNPVMQGIKFDPDGAYIRRWVPELSGVPAKFIHEPWNMPRDVQSLANCVIGVDYPEPIIDHQWARERAMNIYQYQKEAE